VKKLEVVVVVADVYFVFVQNSVCLCYGVYSLGSRSVPTPHHLSWLCMQQSYSSTTCDKSVETFSEYAVFATNSIISHFNLYIFCENVALLV